MVFSDLELDALAETFNLSLGEAAAMFSEMIREEVLLSVPAVKILTHQQLLTQLAAEHTRLCMIQQTFESTANFTTNTLLLFPEQGTVDIVQRMLGDATTIEQITELEQDTLAEVGNIIMTGCMSSLGNLFNSQMNGTLPDVSITDAANVLRESNSNDMFLVARISMSLSSNKIYGFVLFVMDVGSVKNFMKEINKAFHLKN